MDNPIGQVGTDIVEAGRKLGHAIATGASEVKDVLFGKPGDGVPAPPGFDWGATYRGLDKEAGLEYASRYKEQQDEIKQRHDMNQGVIDEHQFKLKMDQLNFDKLTRQSDIVKELRGWTCRSPSRRSPQGTV